MMTRRPFSTTLRLSASAGLALVLTLSAQGQQPVLTPTVFRPVPATGSLAQVVPETAFAGAPEGQAATSAVPKDDLFAGTERFAKGASEVTEINMDPQSLELVEGANAKRAHRTVLSVVRTYSYDKPGMYNPADVEEYRHKLEGSDWHCSVHTRDAKSGESTDVCSKRRAPDMIENAIITVEPKQLTFIHNIRKINGQGSRLDDEGALQGLLAPAFAQLAVLEPALRSLESAQLEQKLEALSQTEAIHPEALATAQRALAEAQLSGAMEQLRNFVPPAPEVPPTPPAPPAFENEGAPPAPPSVPELPRP